MQTDDNPLAAIEPAMGSAPIGTAPGIAAVALTLAMKYHDINTVQDGALYQQYKLEGRNMESLDIGMVFETAIKIERHLLASSDRIAQLVVDAVVSGVEEEAAPEAATDSTT